MANVTKNPSDHLKRTEINIRRRVECEETAFHIVNKLIDGTVDGDYLAKCGKLISGENYNDIIEERAISMMCGYPVCDQCLPNVPKKKYHISTTTNKVYDISERKNFCSNQCYKASQCFRQQIPDSPIWTRNEEPVNIVISPHKGIQGLVGEEVIGHHPKQVLKHELEKLKELDKTGEHLQQNITNSNETESKIDLSKEAEVICDSIKSKLIIKERINDLQTSSNETDDIINKVEREFEKMSVDNSKADDKRNVTPSTLMINEKQNFVDAVSDDIEKSKSSSSKMEQLQKLLNKRKNVLSGMVDLQETKSLSSPTDEKNKKELKRPLVSKEPSASLTQIENENVKSSTMNSPLNVICNVLKKWVTVSTIEYLEYKAVKTESVEQLDGVTTDMSELAIDVDCDPLSEMLDHQEKEIGSFLAGENTSLNKTNKSIHKPTKPVPDYEKLKEESEQFQMKVEEFITGKRVKERSKKKDEKKEEATVYIPTVDAYDQSQIRIRIVLEKLDKSLPEILVPLGLSVQDVATVIREIVYTFRLEKDTIIFKPAEWTLVSLVLLKILSFKMKSVSDAFQSQTSRGYLKVLLEGIRHSLEDLDSSARNVLSNAAVEFKPLSFK